MRARVWTRFQEIYKDVRAVSEDSRAAETQSARGNDDLLCTQPESMSIEGNGEQLFTPNAPVDFEETLAKGQKFGHFEIVGPIGKGSMGEVYRALDLRLKRHVAIKVLPRAFVHDTVRHAQFKREARLASVLNHPNVVSVYDVGEQGELTWIVSELVDGQVLRDVIEKGPIPLRRAIAIGIQIANGLAAAHEAGLVHRDLKPENIMLDRDDRAKILDFGLAKRQWSKSSGDLAETGTWPGFLSGTPAYMSPEQIVGQKLDERSDIFSLGIIMYEMLSGVRPFAGESFVAVMNAALTEEPPPLPAFVPPVLQKHVFHCLEKRPEKRRQSAADFSFALQLLIEEPSNTGRRLHKRKRFWPVLATSAAALGLLAFLAGRYVANFTSSASPGALRRLTWDTGLTTDGVISPDGKFVAYASDRANQTDLDIYVQQIDTGSVVRLTYDEADDRDPAFSADGSKVAFRSERGTGGIYEVGSLGGEPRLLVAGGYHPQYSPDGRYLLYATTNSFADNTIVVQPLAGGSAIELSRGCQKDVRASAVWSPSGNRVLFYGTCKDADTGKDIHSAWIASLDGARHRVNNGSSFFQDQQLVFNDGIVDQWLANPSRILAPFVERDAWFEAAVPIDAERGFRQPVQRLAFGPVKTRKASASMGGRVVLSTVEKGSSVWRLPVDAAGHAKGTPVPETLPEAEQFWPKLSRDGRLLAFVARKSGSEALKVKEVSTETERVLQESPSLDYPVINSTGDRILYGDKNGESELSAGGGFAKAVLPVSGVTDWSADNKLLVLDRNGGYHSVKIFDRRTSKWSTLLSDPQISFYQSHFSRDGKWVTFIASQYSRSHIYVVPVRDCPVLVRDWIPVTSGSTVDDKPQFSPDGKVLFFVSERDGYRCLWAQSLLPDMHPDGSAFAVFHFHSSRRSLGAIAMSDLELSAGPGVLVFNQGERTGNIWLLDPKQK